MTAREFAVLIGAKEIKRGKLWKARCPAHKGDGLSLEIREGKEGVLVKCWSHHCLVKEICAAVGIKVGDLFASTKKYDPRAVREAAEKQRREEEKERRERLRDHVLRLQRYGWSDADVQTDWEVCVASATMMLGYEERERSSMVRIHRNILRFHAERIVAAHALGYTMPAEIANHQRYRNRRSPTLSIGTAPTSPDGHPASTPKTT